MFAQTCRDSIIPFEVVGTEGGGINARSCNVNLAI